MSSRSAVDVLGALSSSRERAGRSSLVDARARPPRARDFLDRPAFARELALETEVRRHDAGVRPFTAGRVIAPPGRVVAPPGRVVAPPGRVIGPYRVIAPIAVGGMGIVLEAVHESTQRVVALKVLRGGTLAGRCRRELFRLQVNALERLSASPPHAGIAELVEVGETSDGTPWFATELVRGVPFSQILARTRPGATAHPSATEHLGATVTTTGLAVFAQVCGTVHHAHAHGVVHGDLAPANVLVQDGGLASKVVDFTRVFDATPECARAPSLVGTLGYAAPERLQGRAEPTVASDVFSLGALLFELLTGAPFRDLFGLGLLASIRRASEATTPRPSNSSAGIPFDLEALALRALDPDPACRPATPAELARAVERHLR